MMDNDTHARIKALSQDVAAGIGRILQQEVRLHRGTWWLFTLGHPMRPLTIEEVEWSTNRGHAPFVENGKTTDDPSYWDAP